MNEKTRQNIKDFGAKVGGVATGTGAAGLVVGQAIAYAAGTPFVPAGIVGAGAGAAVGAVSALVHQRQVAKKAAQEQNPNLGRQFNRK